MIYSLFSVLLVALLPAFVPAKADSNFPLREPLSTLIRSEMREHDVIGLSIAVIDDQKVVWADGFGYAHREKKIPARADTLYAVGGLTQLFTAAAVMQWVDRGAVELDQPVQKHVPEFTMRTHTGASHPITVRQLLSHHGGLPAMHMRDMWTPRPEPLASFVARLKHETAPYPPGLLHSPSFPGYDVLGRLIERHCGHSYARCMKEQLLNPMGMTHSRFELKAGPLPELAMHYWQGEPISSQVVRDIPAAGLASSATELAQLARLLFAEGRLDGKTILSRHSVQELLRPQNRRVPLDLENHVGMPWNLTGIHFPQARTVAWYNNQSPFSRGRMLLLPEHKLAVVILTNSSSSTEAVDTISERSMALLLEARRAPVLAPAQTAVVSSSTPPRRDEVVGHYATNLGLVSVTGGSDGRYEAALLGKTLQLLPTPEGVLRPAYRLFGVIPIPLDVLRDSRLFILRVNDRPQAVAHYNHQTRRLGDRIAPVTLSAAWQKRLGEYQAVEHDDLLKLVKIGNVRLDYLNGFLLLRYRMPGWIGLWANVPLRPVSDTELVVEGTGPYMGESLKITEHNGKEVLRYSGYEFRQVGRP